VAECDLLMPMKVGIDVLSDGDAMLLRLGSQDAVVLGTPMYAGTIYVNWD
jgi:multimeric flavodoxin WrbA